MMDQGVFVSQPLDSIPAWRGLPVNRESGSIAGRLSDNTWRPGLDLPF